MTADFFYVRIRLSLVLIYNKPRHRFVLRRGFVRFTVISIFCGTVIVKILCFGYDYSYLSSFFNRNFDMDFASFVNKYRIQFACELPKKLRRGRDTNSNEMRIFNHQKL